MSKDVLGKTLSREIELPTCPRHNDTLLATDDIQFIARCRVNDCFYGLLRGDETGLVQDARFAEINTENGERK
jgi:hypothetical protein